jgi:hypothetical protein
MIDHWEKQKGFGSKLDLFMHHAMNISHEWSRLKLKLHNNTYVIALLYINPISTKRHHFFGNEIKV